MAKSTGQVCFEDVSVEVLTLSAAYTTNEILEVTLRPPWIFHINERFALVAALRIELATDDSAFFKVEFVGDFTGEVVIFANETASLKYQERPVIVVY